MAGGVDNVSERQSSSSWADLLPHDIINLIANSLHYIDQVSFRAVCRSWRAAYIVRYADKLPWSVCYDSQKVCYLYDPSHRRRYTISKSAASLQKFNDGMHARDSKHDWVLFIGKKKCATRSSSTKLLFLHNPFTDSIIELPAFDNKHTIMNATFSTTPISPDCLIFAISHDKSKGQNHILINRPGSSRDMMKKNWIEFDIEGDYVGPDNFMYVDGFLFYSFEYPRVFGAFDVASEKEYILPHPPSLIEDSDSHMIESDGKLLICYNLEDMDRFHVCRFNRSQKNWFEIGRLEDDRALFILCWGWCPRISVPVENGSELASTIHFLHFTTAYKFRNGVTSEFSPKINAYEDWENWCFRSGCIGRGWIQPPQTGQ